MDETVVDGVTILITTDRQTWARMSQVCAFDASPNMWEIGNIIDRALGVQRIKLVPGMVVRFRGDGTTYKVLPNDLSIDMSGYWGVLVDGGNAVTRLRGSLSTVDWEVVDE